MSQERERSTEAQHPLWMKETLSPLLPLSSSPPLPCEFLRRTLALRQGFQPLPDYGLYLNFTPMGTVRCPHRSDYL